MRDVIRCIENLWIQLNRHRNEGLKEYPTRTIFIDPMLQALGWDVRDPDEVELEHHTVDGKSVDYAEGEGVGPSIFLQVFGRGEGVGPSIFLQVFVNKRNIFSKPTKMALSGLILTPKWAF